jgi:hypothetical protein
MKALFIIAAFASLTVAPFVSARVEAQPHLSIREHKTGEVLLRIPLQYGQAFTIRYIHSVDHAPVFEVFRALKEEGLVLEETFFQMFGAGMGHWEGHGTVVQDGRWIKIKDIHRPLGSFLLRVGSSGVDHTILFNEKEWNLSEKAAGHRVEVTLTND